ncbi:hypothetical protein F4778DRAFT_780847 [Xylariomycetidae sp. FL2044]|nr:hypothetical protein F4778DRAFT_780847 [Xylariomycetidae sp. FL2044]
MSQPQEIAPNGNQQAPLFKKLPYEVRLMIYEFALTEDEPIWPSQVAETSNKFDSCNEFAWKRYSQLGRIYNNERSVRKLQGTNLERVCRQIRDDLVVTPVFYRVNRFNFYCRAQQHLFLAALTPKKRAMIQQINLWAREAENWRTCNILYAYASQPNEDIVRQDFITKTQV